VNQPKDTSRRLFKIGVIAALAAILISITLQLALLVQLSVFKTPIGGWLLLIQFLQDAAPILIFAVAGSYLFSQVQKRRGGEKRYWIIYYLLLGLATFGSFGDGINFGLGSDVRYTTLLTKSGFNYLGLLYLNGSVIWTIFILTALFMFSDPRVSPATGDDGVRRFYMHSKFLGLLRLLAKSNLGQFLAAGRRRRWEMPTASTPKQVEWDVGTNPDHAMINKNGKMQWNDRFRVSSPSFLAWTAFKLLVGLAIAATLAGDIALRFVTIQNYLGQTGSTWQAQLGSYFGILGMRIGGAYTVPASFGIDNTFTFEVFRFLQTFLSLAFVLFGLRLGLSAVANLAVGTTNIGAMGMSRRALSEILAIIVLPVVYVFLNAGTMVYDVGTPLVLWTTILLMGGTIFLTVLTRTRRIFHTRALTRTRGIIILAIVIVSIFTLPAYSAFLRGQSGRYIEYQWTPAYVPTIDYTRWAYGVDSITSADKAIITASTNQTNVLDHIRIFTADSAKNNMKPLVGVNWMSIQNAGVDIIFIKGTEYWVSALQLVQPTISGDVDTWRTQHLLLTHSEKVLAVNAATTETVDISKVWNLNQTPQLYYGEGGLWSSVDEVYLNIPSFNETHLTGYVGPPSYNGALDYTYSGFWRYWKFFWQGRLDFAQGNYGDIKALVDRDVDSRVSKLLLPRMATDSDPYPVVDDMGNIYLLHWTWIDWTSPHDFADYPDHQDTSILRLFATVLTNMKTGEVTGYLYPGLRNDYVTSFYRTMYPQWNQRIPSWLVPQLRYPEQYFNTQQSVYNFYFQTDPLQWQRNQFLLNTEDTRFIIVPINGNLTWAAVRLVEIYQSPSQNLAGLYIAPAGKDTGQVFLIKFPEGFTVIGPQSAVSAVATDPNVRAKLTLNPNWIPGNILLYVINGQWTYVIPYYGSQGNLTVPEMVAVVDGQTKKVGAHFLSNPNDPVEVQGATADAVASLGTIPTGQTTINGTLTSRYQYELGGNTRWLLTITPTSGPPVTVLAKVETLSEPERAKIVSTAVGSGQISVVYDATGIVIKVNLP